MRKYLNSRDMLFADYKAGKASRYIHSFDELKPGDRVFLILRVSGRERRRNLKDQLANLRDVLRSIGVKIVGYVERAISGFDPGWLQQAAREAKAVGATVLLAESTDRFIRHRSFHSIERPDLQATDEQLQELVECASGIPLMTHLHPDASPKQVRSYQRKRGQKYKNAKGGQPSQGFKKRRRMEFKLPIIRLFRQGLGNREIARMLNVAESTVRRWRKRYWKYWAAPFLAKQR